MLTEQAIEDWIEAQSPEIQSLARRFPPGSRIIDSTRAEYFVCGYFEDGSLALSHISPHDDLLAAERHSWTVNKESVSRLRPIGNG